jgi:hypothetical protein
VIGRISLARAFLVAVAATALAPVVARAHDAQVSHLRLSIVQAEIEGEWELHPSDVGVAIGAEPLEGDVAWPQARVPALRRALEQRLFLDLVDGTGSRRCHVTTAKEPVERPGGRDALLLRFVARCPAPPGVLAIRSELFFDRDAAHRTLFKVDDAYQTHVGILVHDAPRAEVAVRRLDLRRQLASYGAEGVRHIWTGLDHVLFLVALLLTAPLIRTESGWLPRPAFSDVARRIAWIVTAFTVAHSLTLVLAVLDVVRVPGRWVEAAIAASVFLAAWNNLRPFLPDHAAAIALGFGLIHGFGFAGALADLGLPRQALGSTLFAFNVGVELGQLAIVAVALPVLHRARRSGAYVPWILHGGSFLIAWLAVIWLVERLAGVELLGAL